MTDIHDVDAKLAGALALIEATPFEESEPLTAAVRLLAEARRNLEQIE